jgi:adenylate cyclase
MHHFNVHSVRKILLVYLLFFLPCLCFAQQNPIDSLKKIIAGNANDTTKVNALIEISNKYRGESSMDTALIYANEAKELAEKIEYPRGLGYSLKAIGLVYNIQGNYVQALEVWKEALHIFEQNGIKVGVANMLGNIGVVFYNRSQEDSALDYQLRALHVSEELKDTFRIATALTNVAAVYSNKAATYDKALEYHRQALFFTIATNDSDLIGSSYSNIGELFISKSDDKLKKKNKADSSLANTFLDSALVYLTKGLKYYTTSPNLPYALNSIGKTYRLKHEYSMSKEYYTKGYEEGHRLNSKMDMAQARIGFAGTERFSGDFKGAIPIYLEAEKMLIELGSQKSYDMKDVYEGLSDCYAKLKDFDNAFKYLTLLSTVKSDIYNLDIDNKLSTKLNEYVQAKNQAEISLRKAEVSRQKIIRNGFIGGFAVVLMFAGVFFTQRNRISKEKKRSDELLLNILPEETAEELKLTGTAQAKSFDLVSVLFTDFKNFTQASEKLTPKELVAEINFCYCEFDKIITKYGLEKIKTIGDAYMCAGGLPAPNTTHPEDIVRAGLAMVRFIEKNKQDRLEKGLPFFELRCGIHTGPVVAGIVGIKKFAYDIWGDTVNTASRMESSGEVGKVNVSGETYLRIKDKFKCTYRGKVKAKNKGEIDMYFVDDVA